MKTYVTPSLREICRVSQEPFCASGNGSTEDYNEVTVDWDN